MPAATKFLMPVWLATAGPSVQTILARRPFLSLIISATRGRRVGVSGTYRMLAFDLLAELSLPLSLTDASAAPPGRRFSVVPGRAPSWAAVR